MDLHAVTHRGGSRPRLLFEAGPPALWEPGGFPSSSSAGGWSDTNAIRHVARAAIRRAGITGVCLGSHTFRHTLATDLLRHGASLDEIGEVLRHKDASTTANYAKVDLKTLRSLAMCWPGATP
jgi:integrase/recombinase XerD